MRLIRAFVVSLSLACVACPSADQTKPIDTANMDTSVKPGEDFYRYANGKWIVGNSIPPDESRWGSFEEVVERSRRAQHEILEEAAKTTRATPGSPLQLAGDLYASAMDEARAERDGDKPLLGEQINIEHIKDFDGLMDQFARMQTLRISAPFALHTSQDAKQSTEVVVHLEQAGLGMPDRDYYTD